MLSKKTQYALIALTKLGLEYGQGPVLISDIANSEKIPQRFLEGILLELKKLGVLGSKLGKKGGYYLLRPPAEISVAEVVRHFEGTIALLYCVSEKAYQPGEFCRDEANCKIRILYKDIRDYTFNLLSATSLESILPDSPVLSNAPIDLSDSKGS